MTDRDGAGSRRDRLAFWLALAACVVGTLLRARGAAGDFPFGDEFHSLRLWRASYAEIVSSYDNRGSGLALPLLQRLGAELLGHGLWAVRLPALVPSVLLLWLVYPLGRALVGPAAAALAALALALNPLDVYFGHFARAYAAAGLVTFLLLWLLARWLRRPTRSRLVGIGAALALLGWLHLGSLPVVASVLVGAGLQTLREPRRALELGLAVVGGAALCGLAYLPALDSTQAYLSSRLGGGSVAPHTAGDVGALLFGSSALAAGVVLAVPLAVLGLARTRRSEAILLGVSVVLPIPLLLLADPLRGPQPTARYLMALLPFAWLLLAWGWVEVGRRLAALPLVLAAGSLVLAGLWFGGPLGRGRVAEPYGNLPLALHPLAAFDQPWPQRPRFYSELADRPEVRRVIEAPAAMTAAHFVYRNHRLAHGKPTLLGYLDAPPGGIVGWPYVSVRELRRWCKPGDVLVVHRMLDAEARDYMESVAAWDGSSTPADARLSASVRLVPAAVPSPGPAALARLERALGPPAYRDRWIVAWDLACTAGP